MFGDDLTFADGGAASQPPRNRFLLPNISREGEEPFTVVHFFNPSEKADTEIQASLYDGAGEMVSSTDRSLGPRGTISESAETFFAVDLEDFQDGYIQGDATGEGVVAFQTFGNEKTINHLAGQATSLRKQSYGVAHIGFGAGLETELNLINSDESKDAEFRVSVFDDQGQAALASVDFVLEPRKQRIADLSVLFGLSSTEVLTGSLEIELLNAFRGPFLNAPSINGSVRSRVWTAGTRPRFRFSGCRTRTPSTPMWHKIKASLPVWPSKTGRGLRLTGPWKRSMRLVTLSGTPILRSIQAPGWSSSFLS